MVYTAVADFVLQSETAEQIAEALKILSSWNPKWQPPYFMTDYSEAEIEFVKFTSVTSTESKPGRDGSKTRSMVVF